MDEDDGELAACDGTAMRLAFSILGKRWNGMILGALGAGPLSFAALRRSVEGISDAMLSDRLSELTGAGLLARVVDPGPPVTVSYGLTAGANELIPVLHQLGRWADSNLGAKQKV